MKHWKVEESAILNKPELWTIHWSIPKSTVTGQLEDSGWIKYSGGILEYQEALETHRGMVRFNKIIHKPTKRKVYVSYKGVHKRRKRGGRELVE